MNFTIDTSRYRIGFFMKYNRISLAIIKVFYLKKYRYNSTFFSVNNNAMMTAWSAIAAAAAHWSCMIRCTFDSLLPETTRTAAVCVSHCFHRRIQISNVLIDSKCSVREADEDLFSVHTIFLTSIALN